MSRYRIKKSETGTPWDEAPESPTTGDHEDCLSVGACGPRCPYAIDSTITWEY